MIRQMLFVQCVQLVPLQLQQLALNAFQEHTLVAQVMQHVQLALAINIVHLQE